MTFQGNSNSNGGNSNPQQTIALAFAVASLQNPIAAAEALAGLTSGAPTPASSAPKMASLFTNLDGSATMNFPQALLEVAAAAAAASSTTTSSATGVSFNDKNSSNTPTHPSTEMPIATSNAPTLPPGSNANTMTKVKTSKAVVDSTAFEDDQSEVGEQEPLVVSSSSSANLDDSERRLARSRERNREHARKTRLRKKAQLEALQSKVKVLEAERQVLKQKVEECGIASILLGLSAGGCEATSSAESLNSTPSMSSSSSSSPSTVTCNKDMVAILSGNKRKRFISEAIGETGGALLPDRQRLVINLDGQETEIGAGKSHINWKTGVYRDQHGVQRQLTSDQLEELRRERNRMHAKMTRSRKKCFIATIQKAIEELEKENQSMRDMLKQKETLSMKDMLKQVSISTQSRSPTPPPTYQAGSTMPLKLSASTSAVTTTTKTVTPNVSPHLSPKQTPEDLTMSPYNGGDDSNNEKRKECEVSAATKSPDLSFSLSQNVGSRPLKKRKALAALATSHGFLLGV